MRPRQPLFSQCESSSYFYSFVWILPMNILAILASCLMDSFLQYEAMYSLVFNYCIYFVQFESFPHCVTIMIMFLLSWCCKWPANVFFGKQTADRNVNTKGLRSCLLEIDIKPGWRDGRGRVFRGKMAHNVIGAAAIFHQSSLLDSKKSNADSLKWSF